MTRRPWTVSEDSLMRDHYPVMSARELAGVLQRTVPSVLGRADVLGLRKDPVYLAETWARCGKQVSSDPRSISTRIQKGVPTTKGMRMSDATREKVKHTWFKKGALPLNTAKEGDGATRIRKDKNGRAYRFVRVAVKVWVHEHTLVWERHNGRPAKGMVIWHKDGDSLNNDISNLECITRAEAFDRVSIHNLPEDIKGLIHAVGTVKRQITIINKKQNGKEQAK
jgi:hypothetical protein